MSRASGTSLSGHNDNCVPTAGSTAANHVVLHPSGSLDGSSVLTVRDRSKDTLQRLASSTQPTA